MDILQKKLSVGFAKELNEARFDDEKMTEWHIISTNQPDHYGDIMDYNGMELPPSGKGIALLNHNPEWTGGLPLGKVLEYQVKDNGGVKELWQHTQYLPDLPNDIGTKTYKARKAGAFVDSSIQFRPMEAEPIENGGTYFKRWQLVEAGPVLVGANWHTGKMKAEDQAIVKDLLSVIEKKDDKSEDEKITAEPSGAEADSQRAEIIITQQPTIEKEIKMDEKKITEEKVLETAPANELEKRMVKVQKDIEDIKASLPRADAEKVIKAEAEVNYKKGVDNWPKEAKELFMAKLIARMAGTNQLPSEEIRKAQDCLKANGLPESGIIRKDDYQNATTNAYGLYVAPTVIVPEVMDIAMAEAQILPRCNILPIPEGAKTHNVPISLGGATVYWPGEAAAITASQAQLGVAAMTPKEYGALIFASKEWLKMANLDAVGWIIKEIGKGIARNLDKQLFAGTDLIATGFRDSATLNAQTIAAATFAITEAEAIATHGYLSDDAAGDPEFFVTRSVWEARFRNLKETTGGNYLFPDRGGNQTFFGAPIVFIKNTGVLPANSSSGASLTMGVLADLKKGLYVGRLGLEEIATSTEASVVVGATTYNMFQRNMVGIRVTGFLAAAIPDFTGATPANYNGVKIVSHA